MGQVESQKATADDAADAPNTREPLSRGNLSSTSNSAANNNPSNPSFDSLLAEAAAFGDENENDSLEAKAQKALECPCMARLRTGPCGSQVCDAFLCFFKSTAEAKGSDCGNKFVALMDCLKTHPEAFAKNILDKDKEEEEVEKAAHEYKIYPPLWSVESKKSKA